MERSARELKPMSKINKTFPRCMANTKYAVTNFICVMTIQCGSMQLIMCDKRDKYWRSDIRAKFAKHTDRIISAFDFTRENIKFINGQERVKWVLKEYTIILFILQFIYFYNKFSLVNIIFREKKLSVGNA